MGTKVFVRPERSTSPPEATQQDLVALAQPASIATKRLLLLVWVGAVLMPFLLQLRSYAQMVAPHKISQSLVLLGAERREEQLEQCCPARGMRIAGVWWNIWPTHYSTVPTGRICHFVVPQYNMHGGYHFASNSTLRDAQCASAVTPVDYYFYHGSIGYFSFYEEGAGTFCPDDWTASFEVTKLGSYDVNGQALADDGGATGYRQSYWLGSIASLWLGFRALVIRRSYILFKRHTRRCQQLRVPLRLHDAVIHIQESARLSAHGARAHHRVLLLFFLLEGLMADLFLFITKGGLSALVQCISLGYNLSAILSTIFELVEGYRCLGKRTRVVKRLLLSHETAMVGELLGAGVIQTFLTTLNGSRLQASMPVAKAISFYAWGLMGHGFFALGLAAFLFVVRALGAVGIAWWKYRSLTPLTADCCVDQVLGTRQKLATVGGYCWSNDKLFYSTESLVAFGLFRVTDEATGELLLVHEKVRWFATPRHGMVAIGAIRGQHVDPIAEQRVGDGAPVMLCSQVLGGLGDVDTEASGDNVEQEDRRPLVGPSTGVSDGGDDHDVERGYDDSSEAYRGLSAGACCPMEQP